MQCCPHKTPESVCGFGFFYSDLESVDIYWNRYFGFVTPNLAVLTVVEVGTHYRTGWCHRDLAALDIG